MAFSHPDSAGRELSEAPAIHPTAEVRDTGFGRFNEIGPRCRVAESVLGDFTYLANDTDVMGTSFGKFCSIASMVRINPGNHPLGRAAMSHFTYRASKYGFGADEPEFFAWRRSFPVTIGHDVWIGHGAVILPGVSLGNGAVVGAGAVVSRDVGDFEIVVGVPAKRHRVRFPAEICAALHQIAWWDWTDGQLKAAIGDFRTLPIEAFCAKYLDHPPIEG